MAVALLHGLLPDHCLKVTRLFHFDIAWSQVLVQVLVRNVLLLFLDVVNPLFFIEVEVLKSSIRAIVLLLFYLQRSAGRHTLLIELDKVSALFLIPLNED